METLAEGMTDNQPLECGTRPTASGQECLQTGCAAPADYRPAPGTCAREGSWLDTASSNVEIIDLALRIEAEGRPAAPEEQRQLSRYVGFGAADIRNILFPVPSAADIKADPDRKIWPKLISRPAWRTLAERLERLPDPWQRSILQSTQYAHFTGEALVRGMWKAIQRLGFTGGQVVDPGSGIGNFRMFMPDSVYANSSYTGIEVDGPTAAIARLLSPAQNVLHADFTKSRFPRDFFDIGIGNVPFSQTRVYADPDYVQFGFALHDFFLAKTVDLVRPGGLMAFVTSRNTMDKPRDRVRAYLSARADLLGAFRLPSTTFEDNAGTAVVADVLFLRKRCPGEEPGGAAWRQVVTVETPDGPAVVNEYFRAHPEMVLGQERFSGNTDGQGRHIKGNGPGRQYTVVAFDQTPAELDARIAAAVERLPEDVYRSRAPATVARQVTAALAFDPLARREGVVYLGDDGTLMRVERGAGRPLQEAVKLSAADVAWFGSYIRLRELVQQARHAQASDGDWEGALDRLNAAYDGFRERHGPLNAYRVQVRKTTDEEGQPTEQEVRIFTNRRRFREDYDSPIVSQLEVIDEEGRIVKAPFLLGRTIGKPVSRDVRTISDALAVSLDALGRLDLDDVGRRIGMSREDAIEALGNQVYRTPCGQWQLADLCLSGDVVGKLEEAEQAVRLDPSLRRNVEALKQVQPEKLGPSQISAKLGASWIPEAYIGAFAAEIEAGEVTFDPATESWQVAGANYRSNRSAGDLYGTEARSPSELLEAALNSRPVKVTKTDNHGKSYTDTTATTAANEVLNKIKDKFATWIWTDAERAVDLVEIYNRRFNNLAPRRFDGSHLTLPGVSLRYKPYVHQKGAVWRIIQTGNTYIAQAVGSGKTMEMVAAGMEQKRLGLINKPMYVVPGHMLQQFALEFLQLYPLGSILVADEDNFCVERRAAFLANATLNDPDAIVITHDAFQRIGITEASVAPIRDEILADLELELSETDGGWEHRVRRRQLQQQIEAVSQRFDRIVCTGARDGGFTFEELGVDFLIVDEAHCFRKLDFHTSQQIKGIDPCGSKRALDMYVKTRWLDRQRPGRAFVMASGTPVTNTMGELYSLMRFFALDELKRAGISTFDAWARQFGEVAATLEPNAAGRYELVSRFARFVNVPELMSRVRNFMDVLTSEYLAALVKRPALKGGRPNLNVIPSSAALQRYMSEGLAPRIEKSRAWRPSPGQPANPDPVVSIITDGRFAAIDPRFFGGALGPEGSIITVMAAKVAAAYHAGSDRVYVDEQGRPEPIKGSTQLVFFNLGFGAQSMRNRGFDARAAFTRCLVELGVPREQIGWFEDASTYIRKEAMCADMRSGKLRILIGSAKKMGTGLNVQKRLAVLHYQDPPWYPADVEQPHGRILRPGNQNEEVAIEWYTTKGTYQSSMWMMVARKQRFIEQAFTGDKTLRSMDDLSEASLFDQAAAVASGDPRAIHLAGLRQEVHRFERLQAAHESEQVNVRSALRQAEWQLSTATGRVSGYGEAFRLLGERHFAFSGATVGDAFFEKHGEFGAVLKDAFNAVAGTGRAAEDEVLARLGDAVSVTIDGQSWGEGKPCERYTLAVCVGTLSLPLGTNKLLGRDVDAVGLAQRIVNVVNGVAKELEYAEHARTQAETEITRLRRKVGAPFEYQRDMAEKYAELKLLEESLRLEDRTTQPAPPVDAEVGAHGGMQAALAQPDSGMQTVSGQPSAAVGGVGACAANEDGSRNLDLFGILAAWQIPAPLAAVFGAEDRKPAGKARKQSASARRTPAAAMPGSGTGTPDLFGVTAQREACAARAGLFGEQEARAAQQHSLPEAA